MTGTLAGTEIIVILLVGGSSIFWVWMLCDAVTNRRLTRQQRYYWAVLIALTHVLGALSYMVNRSEFEQSA